MLRLVLMGVSGCGKTSVGEALSRRLRVPYLDGDTLHPVANVEKMRAGVPLADDDRWPWLDRVAMELCDNAPLIIGCSALRQVYRDHIRAGANGRVQFVHLAGERKVIVARMAKRAGHYMPLSLLDSQFAALEPPGPNEAIAVEIVLPFKDLVDDILRQLRK